MSWPGTRIDEKGELVLDLGEHRALSDGGTGLD
jgi:hypothetical protein